MKTKLFFTFIFSFLLIQCSMNTGSSGSSDKKESRSSTAVKSIFSSGSIPVGTWIWHTAFIKDDTTGFFSFMTSNNITEVYLHYNSTLSSYYESFIQKAKSYGISTQLLGGSSSWALPGYSGKFKEMIAFIHDFNLNNPNNSFTAIHLDVEPYLYHSEPDVDPSLRDLWKTDRAAAILYYQDFISAAYQNVSALGLELYVDIPFWFDNTDCVYNNKYGSGRLSDWVINNSDATAIMAYRDKAADIINISSNEMASSSINGKKIMIGVQTALDELNYLSFYEEGSDYMSSVLQNVQADLSSKYSNWGFSIHYLNSWMELEQKPSKGKWQFEGNVNDSSGNSNNGTVIGSASYTNGYFGKYFSFNRSNYIQIPSYSNFNSMSSFTIEAWIFPTGYVYSDPIISKVNPNRDFVFQLDESGRLNVHFAINYNVYFHCTSSSIVPLNQWSHVAAVWTGSKWQLYCNGNLVAERDCGGNVPAWTGTLMGIGTMNYQYNFLGNMDKVRINQNALTSDKIYYDWLAGKSMIE